MRIPIQISNSTDTGSESVSDAARHYKYSTMSHLMAILGHEAIAAPLRSVNNFWNIGKMARSTSFSSDIAVPNTLGVLCTCEGVGFFNVVA